MSNDSATGGYVVPEGAGPVEDDVLTDVITDFVSGITGLARQLVRPRWQPQAPNQPDRDVDWCAAGVTEQRPYDHPYVAHDAAGDNGEGVDRMQRHEELEVLVSFYGPNSSRNAKRLRDGLYIGQNRDAMTRDAGLKLIGCGAVAAIPELVNSLWLNRADLRIELRRQIDRVYPIRNVKSAQVELEAEGAELHKTDIIITERE
ncbi:MAG: hypothetical protein E6Q98_16045 [Rhodospirillaceae bacterium]|nr:MAG: hypothetical protein E6Q98_16045 [Rhodospirillaceae bacterium]